jgi:phosphoribosylaminoimidazole-succinocarboxamide synthase
MISMMDLDLYKRAYEHAAARGLLVLDTKFENDEDGKLVDEVLTPDSSRYTTPDDLKAAIAEGRDPIFYDKEPVRIWGRNIETPWGTGLQKLDPETEDHLAFISELDVPMSVIEEAEARYLDICHRITGHDLNKYLSEVMKVPMG